MPSKKRTKPKEHARLPLAHRQGLGEPLAGGSPDHSGHRKSAAIPIAIIVAITFALYLPSFSNDYIWDDADYVYANPWIQGTSTILDIWFSRKTPQYYPMTFSSFWLEHKIWGLNPAGYHVVNCLLHIANAVLLYLLMRKLFQPFAFPVALVFAIHPIQVETVAWISERKNVLAVLFFLLATHFSVQYHAERRSIDYVYSLLMFVLSLLSKSITVSFVFVPFLMKWWRKQEIDRWDYYRIIPFFAVGVTAGLNTVWLEVHKVGAQGAEWDLSFLERAQLPARITLFYIYKIFIPFNYVFSYPRWKPDPASLVQWVPSILLIGMLALLLRYRDQVGRGAVATFIFFIISLFPALGIFNVYPMRYSFVADHFAYLSTIPMTIFMVGTYSFIFLRFLGSQWLLSAAVQRQVAWLVVIVGSTIMAAVSVLHTRDFRDAETLWLHVIEKNPQSLLAYNNLGLIYQERGQIEEAMRSFEKGLAVDPLDAEIRNNMGIILAGRGHLREAMEQFAVALKANPRYPNTYNNIATVYVKQGQEDKAILFYERCLKVCPGFPQALFNLGRIYRKRGQVGEAIGYFERAVGSDPSFVEAHLDLGATYGDLGLPERAIREFSIALSLSPRDPRAYHNLAIMYLKQGKVDAAISGFESALRFDPNLLGAHYNLGYIYRSQGRLGKAYVHFQKVKDLGGALEVDVDRFLQAYRGAR